MISRASVNVYSPEHLIKLYGLSAIILTETVVQRKVNLTEWFWSTGIVNVHHCLEDAGGGQADKVVGFGRDCRQL